MSFVTIGAVEWLDMARIVRSQTLSIKQRDFVAAAEALGAARAPRRPNASGPIAAYLAVLVPRVILLESWTLLITRPYCVVERVRLASAPDLV